MHAGSPSRLPNALLLALAACVLAGTTAAAATYVVDRTDDDLNANACSNGPNDCSLRGAIGRANDNLNADEITFDSSVFAAPRKRITLTGGPLVVNDDGALSITAPAAGVEISGDYEYRVFEINDTGGGNGLITFTALTIMRGFAGDGSGGGIRNRAKLLVQRCTLTDNIANVRGGAIYSDTDLDNSTLTIRNSTLTGNSSAGAGGAVFNENGRTFLDSSTVARNLASSEGGGGVASAGDSLTSTDVINSIIAGNTGRDVDYVGGDVNSFVSHDYNLIGHGNATPDFTGSGDVVGNSNPGLAQLAENGGPTPTLMLLPGSRAINTGNTILTIDQRGGGRPQAGADDIGAVELVFTPVESLVVTTVADEDNASSDSTLGHGTSLREAIAYANAKTGDDTISFASGLSGIIELRSELPTLQTNVTLAGRARHSITIRRHMGGNYRLFTVPQGVTVTMWNLTFSNGNALNGDGGAIRSEGTLTVVNSTFEGNSCTYDGGAIYTRFGTLNLFNSTLTGNTAGVYGGGVSNVNGTANVRNCTIVGNTSHGETSGGGQGTGIGGGVASYGPGTTATRVGNSIVALNSGGDVGFTFGGSNSFQSNGHNRIGGGNAAGGFNAAGDVTGATGAQLQLGALAWNGGSTQTIALGSGSSAINQGSNAWVPPDVSDADNDGNTSEATPFDQRGYPHARFFNGTADIGAFEVNIFNESLVVTTLADEDDGTSDPIFGSGTSLREAITLANSNVDHSTITFAPAVTGTIQLTSALPALTRSFRLTGPGARALAVRGQGTTGNHRILTISPSDAPISAAVTGLTLTNGGADSGGALFSEVALELTGCALSNNTADSGGAVTLVAEGTNTVMTDCTFNGNTASDRGGAIYLQTGSNGTLRLRNCTITGNSAPLAAGVFLLGDGNSPVLRMESCTVADNTGTSFGGAVSVIGIVSAEASGFVRNSIFSNNLPVNLVAGGQDGATGTLTSVGNNLASDDGGGYLTAAGDQTNTDPVLGPLANNGGNTPTRALLLGSPAIDTGGATNLATDQRGLARVYGGALDKGAYELQPETYAFWSSYMFPAGTPSALLGPDADADGDGTRNGLEQAFGRNPLAADSPAGLLEFAVQGEHFVLQFERSMTIDPAKIFAEQSSDLQQWTSSGIAYLNLGQATPTTELIRALIPITNENRKFGRVRYAP